MYTNWKCLKLSELNQPGLNQTTTTIVECLLTNIESSDGILYLGGELSLSIFGGLQVDPQLLLLQSQLQTNETVRVHWNTLAIHLSVVELAKEDSGEEAARCFSAVVYCC